MTIRDDLQRFWASNQGGSILVNAFRFEVTDISGTPTVLESYNVCDYREEFTATTENGTSYLYQPLAMQFSVPDVDSSTQQTLHLTVDGVEGTLYSILRRIAKYNRITTPVYVYHRFYLDTEPSYPQIDPPAEYTLVRATVDLSRVTLELGVRNTPNKLAGEYYTTNRFPGLRL